MSSSGSSLAEQKSLRSLDLVHQLVASSTQEAVNDKPDENSDVEYAATLWKKNSYSGTKRHPPMQPMSFLRRVLFQASKKVSTASTLKV